jgi:hypothetical protein
MACWLQELAGKRLEDTIPPADLLDKDRAEALLRNNGALTRLL